MKKEDLYEGFGALNDKILIRSEEEVMKKINKSYIIKICGLVACLIAVVGISVFFMGNKPGSTEDNEVGDTSDIAENNEIDNENVSVSTSCDAAPMVYVNGTLFQRSPEAVCYEELLPEFVYVGKIENDILSDGTDGVPAENMQANTPIVGARVYSYGENIVVYIDDMYWLYEAQGTDDNSQDWDSLTEEEKMQLDPTYLPNGNH